MTSEEARKAIAEASQKATHGNTDEAIRLLGGVILSMIDAADPDVEELIEKQRADDVPTWVRDYEKDNQPVQPTPAPKSKTKAPTSKKDT